MQRMFAMVLSGCAILGSAWLQGASAPKLVGYYANWTKYGQPGRQEFAPLDIRGDLLTHINYAFAKPYTTDAARNVTSYKISLTDPWADTDDAKSGFAGNFGQLLELKKRYPHLKTLLSIGGWSIFGDSGMPKEKFSKLAADPKLRQEFINSTIELCVKYGFDGIDIDWEYPDAADADNFVILMRELSVAAKNEKSIAELNKKLGTSGAHTLLVTMAAPPGAQRNNLRIGESHKYLDWINIMAYDYHGSWPGEPSTNHNAPMKPTAGDTSGLSVSDTVQFYLSAGVPAHKLVLGMPLYGRSFGNVASSNGSHGLLSSFSGSGPSTFPAEPGMLLYNTVYENYLQGPNGAQGFKVYWDDVAEVPYLHNASTKEFISYDDARSLKIKADFVKEKGLGGAMFWCLLRENPYWDLVHVVHDELTKPASPKHGRHLPSK